MRLVCSLQRGLLVAMAMLSLHPRQVCSCYIHGTDSGICTEDLPVFDRGIMLPFCGTVVTYSACVPNTLEGVGGSSPVAKDRRFIDGRYSNHTAREKDEWVERTVKEMIKYRLGLEVNDTLLDKGEDEYGIEGGIEPRFHRNADCRNAYKNYMCWINFPRCEKGTKQSLMTCRSSCENFFRVCGYEEDLWRCGPSKYFNGYEPEQGTQLRDYFPGQPFRDYDPLRTTCTPSLEGIATFGRGARGLQVLLVTVALTVCSLIFLPSAIE